MVGLFTPSKVDIYKMPTGVYIVVNSLVPICIKAKSPTPRLRWMTLARRAC